MESAKNKEIFKKLIGYTNKTKVLISYEFK